MADEAPKTETAAPAAPTPAAPAATPAATPHETRVVIENKRDKDDPALSRLFAAEKQIEDLRAQLEGEKAKVKQLERDGRKSGILGSLYDAFPGLSREEIRGAALVAQEDGKVDLYSAEAEKQVEALKELLAKKKTAAPTTTPAPASVSLGGTPGAPAKPPTSNGLRSGPRKWGI